MPAWESTGTPWNSTSARLRGKVSRAHRRHRQLAKGCPRSTQARHPRFAAVQLIACGKSGGETFPLSVGFSSLRGPISAGTRSPALHGIIDAGSPAPHCTIIASLAAPGTATRGCNTGPLIAVSVSIRRLYERFFKIPGKTDAKAVKWELCELSSELLCSPSRQAPLPPRQTRPVVPQRLP